MTKYRHLHAACCSDSAGRMNSPFPETPVGILVTLPMHQEERKFSGWGEQGWLSSWSKNSPGEEGKKPCLELWGLKARVGGSECGRDLNCPLGPREGGDKLASWVCVLELNPGPCPREGSTLPEPDASLGSLTLLPAFPDASRR